MLPAWPCSKYISTIVAKQTVLALYGIAEVEINNSSLAQNAQLLQSALEYLSLLINDLA